MVEVVWVVVCRSCWPIEVGSQRLVIFSELLEVTRWDSLMINREEPYFSGERRGWIRLVSIIVDMECLMWGKDLFVDGIG
jgi:hypothetical protein